MINTAIEVIEQRAKWSIDKTDAMVWLELLPPASIDLFVFSPPYEVARTYGIDFKLKGQDWVDWMALIFQRALRACKGLVVCVCEGQTNDFSWSGTPALLMADLIRAGVTLRKPPIYHRVGIPGSGGPDWLRNDYEFCICATNGGKLPWSNNTACGHPPKWAPGGEISHRTLDGTRVNATKGSLSPRKKGFATSGHADGDTPNGPGYDPPMLANPGNVIKCRVGGGKMGDAMASQNEAPFPEQLVEMYVRSFCPPDGLVADCFSGSCTTGKVSIAWNRRFVGCDIRNSQVKLGHRRLSATTPTMFPDMANGATE